MRDYRLNIKHNGIYDDCETLKDAIRVNIKAGKKKPTFNLLSVRRIRLKSWTTDYSEFIIKTLIENGEIIIKEGLRNTQYYLT